MLSDICLEIGHWTRAVFVHATACFGYRTACLMLLEHNICLFCIRAYCGSCIALILTTLMNFSVLLSHSRWRFAFKLFKHIHFKFRFRNDLKQIMIYLRLCCNGWFQKSLPEIDLWMAFFFRNDLWILQHIAPSTWHPNKMCNKSEWPIEYSKWIESGYRFKPLKLVSTVFSKFFFAITTEGHLTWNVKSNFKRRVYVLSIFFFFIWPVLYKAYWCDPCTYRFVHLMMTLHIIYSNWITW